jgi:hypothetical protein
MLSPAPTRPLLVLIAWAAAGAGESAAPTPSGPWSTRNRIGVFLTSIATRERESSRDSTIQGSADSTNYLASGDLTAEYRSGKWAIDQNLRLRYGHIRQTGQRWAENNDEVHVDGVCRYVFTKPTYGFVGWGWDTVFTSPVPQSGMLTPGTYQSSLGLGRLYEDFGLAGSKFDMRAGIRAQRRYGFQPPSPPPFLEAGSTAYVRYEHAWSKRGSAFVQYEGFSPFVDPGHVTHLATAAVVLQFNPYVTAELRGRAYYENAPRHYPDDARGYQELSTRQEILLGLTYSF